MLASRLRAVASAREEGARECGFRRVLCRESVRMEMGVRMLHTRAVHIPARGGRRCRLGRGAREGGAAIAWRLLRGGRAAARPARKLRIDTQ